eukprot:scaffold131389_cov27-Tisochrysis_lutea.AAC.1
MRGGLTHALGARDYLGHPPTARHRKSAVVGELSEEAGAERGRGSAAGAATALPRARDHTAYPEYK